MTQAKSKLTPAPPAELGPRALATVARIKAATRHVFLTSGYAGTTVDEIATAASVSRASFYSYFPSKREVLIAVGAESSAECLAAIDRLKTLNPTLAALEGWVSEYFVLLDLHGSFAFAWTQAAQEDDGIRRAGLVAHLALCKRLGKRLGELVATPHDDPQTLGLTVMSLMERSWDFVRLYGDAVDRRAVEAQAARLIWGAIRPTAASVRTVRHK